MLLFIALWHDFVIPRQHIPANWQQHLRCMLAVPTSTITMVAFPQKTFSLQFNKNILSIFDKYMECHESQFVGSKTKGRISKRVLQENKARQIVQKTKAFYPLIRASRCAYEGVRDCFFSRKFGVLCFLVKSVLTFALLPYCRQILRLYFLPNV